MKIIKQLFCKHDWDATDTSGHEMVCPTCYLDWSIYESWGEKHWLCNPNPEDAYSLKERIIGFIKYKFLARTQYMSWSRLELF
jgi:hypothetical protein